MPTPFPGMDPYLEHYELWESVHAFLIGALAEDLSPRIRPRYRVSIQQRFYVLDVQEQLTVGVADALLSRSGASPVRPNGRGGASDGAQAHPREANGVAVRTVELPEAGQIRQRYLETRRAGSHEVVTVVEVLSPVNKRAGDGRHQYEAKRLAVANSSANLVEIDLLRDYQPLPVLEGGSRRPGKPWATTEYWFLVARNARGQTCTP